MSARLTTASAFRVLCPTVTVSTWSDTTKSISLALGGMPGVCRKRHLTVLELQPWSCPFRP